MCIIFGIVLFLLWRDLPLPYTAFAVKPSREFTANYGGLTR